MRLSLIHFKWLYESARHYNKRPPKVDGKDVTNRTLYFATRSWHGAITPATTQSATQSTL